MGCRTGLEIEALLKRVLNALVIGVDVSKNMLEELKQIYAANMDQIELLADGYYVI